MSSPLAAEAEKHYWHHSIDLGHGVVTRGNKSVALLHDESRIIFDRVDLKGKTVLDIGCWNGFFSFEAKRRGAARVLATDSVIWSDPKFRGRETFELARRALNADVEAQQIDAAEISIETAGLFDVVLYLGVFYHRYDTIEVLDRVAAVARQVLVIETHLDMREVSYPAMRFYPGDELGSDTSNWWGPNEQLLEALLRRLGFIEVEIAGHPVHTYQRAIIHAWRSTDSRLVPLPEDWRLAPLPPPQAPIPSPKVGVGEKIVREVLRPFRRLATRSRALPAGEDEESQSR